MSFLFDSAYPSVNPADTEAVRLGASRIRALQDMLQQYLSLLFTNSGSAPTVSPAFGSNVIPGSAIANNGVTATQIANNTVGSQQLAQAAFGNGLIMSTTTSPVAVNADGVTLGFDSSSPPKLQVIGTPAAASAVVSGASNLILQTTGTATITIAADEVVLKNSSGIPFLARSVSVTANSALGVALNGLETNSALTANTWYYIWLISNGTAVACVLEDGSAVQNSGGTGVLPLGPNLSWSSFNGYTYKGLVGVVRTDASSHFLPFWQAGREIFIDETYVFQSMTGTTSYSQIPVATVGVIVPPNAKVIKGQAGNQSGNSGTIAVAGNSSGLGASYAVAATTGQTIDGFALACSWYIPLPTAQTFYVKMSNTQSNYSVGLTGYNI